MQRLQAVHAVHASGPTLCGLDPANRMIADEPGEVTCKSCIKVRRGLEDHQQMVSRSQDARWTRLRTQIAQGIAIEQEHGDGYADLGTIPSWDKANQHWGKAEALREVLASMDREAGQAGSR